MILWFCDADNWNMEVQFVNYFFNNQGMEEQAWKMEVQFIRSKTSIKEVCVTLAARTQFQSVISLGQKLWKLRISNWSLPQDLQFQCKREINYGVDPEKEK